MFDLLHFLLYIFIWMFSSFAFAEGTFEKDKILQFLNDNKFPLVTFLTEVNSVKVYASDKLQVFITLSSNYKFIL